MAQLQRSGKWTTEEEDYAKRIIRYFNSGRLRITVRACVCVCVRVCVGHAWVRSCVGRNYLFDFGFLCSLLLLPREAAPSDV